MIEFKGECGHTVRARDEDAGTVVRCSYCGRKATVPDSKDDELDLLFKDVGGTDQLVLARPRPKRPRRWWRSGGPRPRLPRKFDPFAIILKMCYAALLLIIVIFVGKRYIAPLFREGGMPPWLADGSNHPQEDAAPARTAPSEPRPRVGLVTRICPAGLYVNSTPDGADAYCIEASKVTGSGRIHLLPGVLHNRVTSEGACFQRLPGAGPYVLELAFKLNDRKLFDPNLPDFERYRDFRRKIESTADKRQAEALLEEYFLPDGASAVFIDSAEGQIHVVRQYKDVFVQRERTTGVRGLFLPKLQPGGSGRFSIGRLLAAYIPNHSAYEFDVDWVRSELIYQYVPEADLDYVLDALRRIGVVPCITEDHKIKLFMIGVDDGEPSSAVIGEAPE